ncbi:MAG: LysR family transcriptional regulator [Gammaproteobacteria bacterium]|nr:LysR family transcriptional regulator [Gammaproteobacteria bacterium]
MKEKLYPWLRQMTLKQLRGFDAVVQAGSVSGAARELHLTPPAVSLQLRDLENAIGIPLLERSESGLVPTLAGQQLFELSQELQGALSRFGESITELQGIDHGEVSVGVVSTARYFAPMVLAEFMRIYQDIKIQLQVGNRATIMQKLENLELDFAITGLPPEHFEVNKEFISNHPQIIIAAPDHPLANQARIPLGELKDETFLLREPGSGTRAVSDKLFARLKDPYRSGLEFGSNETIKQAVMAGMGIALISAHTVAAELKEKRLIALDVKGTPINRKWFVVKHANKRFLPSAQALWNFVARNGKHYLPKA